LLLLAMMAGPAACLPRDAFWMGANVKPSDNAPWGGDKAQESLRELAATGASRAFLVAFIWQHDPADNQPVLGSDSQPEQIRAGLRQMRQAGLEPVLKVHLWIPGHWAGDASPRDVAAWFAAYQRALLQLVDVAREEHVKTIVMATELRQLQDAPQWPALVQAIRSVYAGQLLYVADSLDHAEGFTHWSLFDAVAVSLYPPLPEDVTQRLARMRQIAGTLRALGEREQRPVWVAELGLRSARGSLEKPWESPEQRTAPVDLAQQAQVLEQWRQVLQDASIAGLSIWCWYTDPDAGGPHDSDFTPQGKPAARVFRRARG
jgi:hypothetical protein